MATISRSTAEAPAARPALLQALRVTSMLVPTLILIQALFAGQGLFIDTDQLDVHGMIGNLTFLVVLVQALLVLFAGFRGRERVGLIAMSLVLLVLVFVQLGLGYSGRDGGQPAAWHVPNGVLIFGMSVGIASVISRVGRATSAP